MRMKITVVLHNIRSTYNVGAVLRTCEGLGIERVVYAGYTPRYKDTRLLPHLQTKLDKQIAKSALGAEELVEQISLEETTADKLVNNRYRGATTDCSESSEMEQKDKILVGESAEIPQNPNLLLTNYIKCAIMEGYRVVGLENNLNAAELPKRVILGEKTTKSGEKVDFGDRLILILGEEVEGIPAEIREHCQYFLEIPMHGKKESFNVSVATGIALWGLQNLY